MMRPRLALPRLRLAQQLQQRSVHMIPRLEHDFRQGVPGLFSADGFNMAWEETMTYNLDKLNSLIAGTDLEPRDTKQIIHATARDPDQAPIFNYASMAHNTHFFFKNLTPDPKPMPETLARDLASSFSSVETLRREMIITAASMFGPGFVWLVKKGGNNNLPSASPSALGGGSGSPQNAEYKILTTYLAGTPYPGAHWRFQGQDMNTVGADGSAAGFLANSQRGQQVGVQPPGSLQLVPLLCISTWEHVWLRDYGVGGKKAFAEAWWDSIDWQSVQQAASIRARVRPDMAS